jgi:hypothetical protein
VASLGDWVPAPAFDDEHPDELSYRPFPIAPFLTTSSAEPLMADLVAHDASRTLALLDQIAGVQPLRFRPGEQLARMMWAQQFTGTAIGISKLTEARQPDPQTGPNPPLVRRQVQTSRQ